MADTVKTVDWRGIRGLVAAELLTDAAGGVTYGTPFPICGTAVLTKTTETSSATKFYDNVAAIVIQGNGSDEVGIEGSAIPMDVRAKLFGEYYDETTGMYVEGEPVTKYFAIGYITEMTDGTEMYVWRLKGTFSYPEDEHATKDDGTDSTGNTITYTGVNTQCRFVKTGKTAKAVYLPGAKYAAGEAAFFEQVQTPDTIAAD